MGSWARVLTGVAFALGWTPCVGPILASILTLAATGGGPLSGALLLLAYSLGLGVPFLLAGLFFVRAVGALAWVKRHFAVVKIASGALLVVYGVLLVTGRFSWLSSQLSGYRLFDFYARACGCRLGAAAHGTRRRGYTRGRSEPRGRA